MKYNISSVQGSAGGPVFKQEAGKLPYMVAIHNGYTETKNRGVNTYMNYGVHLLQVLNHCTGKHSLPSKLTNLAIHYGICLIQQHPEILFKNKITNFMASTI